MADLRTIKPIPLSDALTKEMISPGPAPEIRQVDPRSLHVDDRYQRNISERSMALILRIATQFSWRAFKPPIVAVDADGRMVVIDGQHTAIGAASHPLIETIPVVVVEAGEMVEQAKAFIAHNRDRVGMTHLQLHHAALAAGDEIAVAVDQACRRAGVRILRNPQAGSSAIGDTMAVTTIAKITKARGVNYAARLLKILVEAGRAPVDALSINAVDELLTDVAWKNTFEPEAMSLTIRSRGLDEWVEWAEVNVRKGMKMTKARALAQAWWLKVRKKRAT